MTTHYYTSTNRNNTHIGMLSTTASDYFSVSKYVAEVVENLGLEAKIVGDMSGCGGNLRVCRETLESKYSNNSVFHHPIPSSTWIAYIGRVLQGGSAIDKVR